MSKIKINRAAKLSPLSKYPRTWEAIIAAIPPDVIKASTAKQIASLADTMSNQFEVGHSAGYKDAGRPKELDGGKRVNVYLDSASLARAAELGNGNVSEGIRIALARPT